MRAGGLVELAPCLRWARQLLPGQPGSAVDRERRVPLRRARSRVRVLKQCLVAQQIVQNCRNSRCSWDEMFSRNWAGGLEIDTFNRRWKVRSCSNPYPFVYLPATYSFPLFGYHFFSSPRLWLVKRRKVCLISVMTLARLLSQLDKKDSTFLDYNFVKVLVEDWKQ